MKLEKTKRVLLIELTNADQFPGQVNRTFPFISGYLDMMGKKRRWIRYALPTAHLLRNDSDMVRFGSEELKHLLGVAKDLVPDLVIATHTIDSEQIAKLRRIAPKVVVVVGDLELVDESLCLKDSSQVFRGIHELDRPGFVPRYDWEPGNEAATQRALDNIYLVPARRCGYFKSVLENPWYSHVALPDAIEGGCAFCCGRVGSDPGREGSLWVGDGPTPDQWFTSQIQAIASDRLPDLPPKNLLLEDIESQKSLHTVLQAMSQLELANKVELLVGIRVDRLLSLAPWLKGELSGGRKDPSVELHIFSCGVESFSQEELGRLNKGTTPLMNVKGINLLKELEARHSGRFSFSRYAGLSMILFTPWTTLADLHLNVGLIRHLRLESAVGNAFVSRLRLHPDLAITHLARQDGLLIDEEKDPVLKSNRRKLFREELPWRHIDDRLVTLSSVVARLDPDKSLEKDPLYRQVEEAFATSASETAPGLNRASRRRLMFEVFECLIEASLVEKVKLTEKALVEKGHEILTARRTREKSRKDRPQRFRLGEEELPLSEYLDRALPLVASGLKPALSIEGLREGDLSEIDLKELTPSGLHHALIDDKDGLKTLIVAVGRIELLALLKIEGEKKPISRARAGQLYGYPKCCARAFSSSPHAHAPFPWSVVGLRAEKQGSIGEAINPLLAGELGFIPCSPDCRAARQVLSQWLCALGVPRPLYCDTSIAFVFHLDPDENELVSLRVTATSESSLTYDPESVPRQNEMRAASGTVRSKLMLGDKLRFVPGQIQLFGKEELLWIWTASIGLWYAGRTWHEEFWKETARSAMGNVH